MTTPTATTFARIHVTAPDAATRARLVAAARKLHPGAEVSEGVSRRAGVEFDGGNSSVWWRDQEDAARAILNTAASAAAASGARLPKGATRAQR